MTYSDLVDYTRKLVDAGLPGGVQVGCADLEYKPMKEEDWGA